MRGWCERFVEVAALLHVVAAHIDDAILISAIALELVDASGRDRLEAGGRCDWLAECFVLDV